MPYLVLAVALAVGLVLLVRWFVAAQPTTVIKFLRWTGLILLVLGGVFLAISGRLGWLLFLLPVLLPWFMRARSAARMAKNFARMAAGGRGTATGQTSQIETRFLRMNLNHDTGEMNGQVLDGRFAGRQLGDLSFDDLLTLYGECAPLDEQSAQVLTASFDRNFPDDIAAGIDRLSGGKPRVGPLVEQRAIVFQNERRFANAVRRSPLEQSTAPP